MNLVKVVSCLQNTLDILLAGKCIPLTHCSALLYIWHACVGSGCHHSHVLSTLRTVQAILVKSKIKSNCDYFIMRSKAL